MLKMIATLIICAFLTDPAFAKTFKELFPDRTLPSAKANDFVAGIDFQQGEVKVSGVGLRMRVGPEFYFLGSNDARKVLVEAWGNPPDSAEHVLGMIMPRDKTPLDDTWGAVVSFDEDGFVSDEDASGINYAELLRTMQAATEEASKQRVAQGFRSLKLVGWASQPFYDKQSHKLHWAKELEFDNNAEHTLNYDVRALGRRGVLKINFVADMRDLPTIKQVIPAVMQMPEFSEGFRYQDYVPGTDKLATYGIGGLIAGKALSKLGLLAMFLVFLKKGWILVVLAVAALWRGFKRLFGAGSAQT